MLSRYERAIAKSDHTTNPWTPENAPTVNLL
jgi:hypothetical protein